MSGVISTDIEYQGPILDAAAMAAMDLGDDKQRDLLHNFITHELLAGNESCVFDVVQAVINLEHHQGVNGMTMSLVLDRVRRNISEAHSTALSNLTLMQSLNNNNTGNNNDSDGNAESTSNNNTTATATATAALPPLSNIESLLVDAIWVADAEIDEMEPDEEVKKKKWTALVQLISMLKGQGLLTESIMQERFSIDLLSKALPRFPAKAFETECIRRRTKMIYKQQKFNLLREESEGYAKLATELVRDIPKSGASTMVLEQHAKETLLRVQSLIGYFDLDPNRVLDIILDLFAYHLLRHHAYFLTLIRASPWYETRERPTNVNTGQSTTQPGQAIMVNVFAQLMGQKFTYYSRWQQEHPDRSTRTPEEITFAAALLIREGIMSVDQLLPHLTPTMEETKDEYKKYLQSKIDGLRSSRLNILATAGALVDDSPSMSSHLMSTPMTSVNNNNSSNTAISSMGAATTTTAANNTSNSGGNSTAQSTSSSKTATTAMHAVPHQRADLCAALLAIGDLKGATRLLALHPYLPSIRVDVALGLGRVIDYLIEPLYEPVRPVPYQKIVPSGRLDYTWDIIPTGNSVFFFSPWTDRLDEHRLQLDEDGNPCIHGLRRCLSLLQLGLSKCPALLVKICRIAVRDLVSNSSTSAEQATTTTAASATMPMISDKDEEMMQRKKDTWMYILREHLLPAISCMRANPAVLHELWLLLEQYSYQQRFGIYGEWTTRYGENTRVAKATKEQACIWGLILARAKTESAIKDIMQRISVETIKESGRRLAKASHAAPTIAFRAVMLQLRTYDNMTQSVTDAFKYLSRFGYDVLTYTILELFANGEDRLQQDGQHISSWFRNLASFCGQAIRRYSSISSEAIAQYIVNQIRKGSTIDLFILEQMIKEVASMEAGAIFTEHQLYAAGGGDILRREALIVEKSPRPLRRPGVRLMRSLLHSGLGIVLAVLMGQLRRDIIYTSEQDFLDNLKVLGSRYDQLSGQQLQYAEFFREFTSPTEYDATLPDLHVLCGEYGLEPEVAFHWLRPKYQRQLTKRITQESAVDEKKTGEEASAVVNEVNTDTDPMQVDSTTTTTTSHDSILLTPEVEVAIRSLLPSDVWDHISPAFYMTFWQLSMYDIYVPEAQYTAQERTLRDERQDIERGHRNLIYQNHSIRHTMCSRINGWEKGLRGELEAHKKHVASIMNVLEQEKDQWFSHIKDPRITAAYIFQYCIRPRLLFSDVDALYCFKFVETMHRLAVPGLWTFGLYTSVLRRSMSNWIFSCTEKEAKRLGQYLKHTLAKLTRWHMKEGEFAKEGIGMGWPGFAKQPCVNLLQQVPVLESQQMSLDDMTSAMITWHRYLHETFADCLASGEYMQIRNAISILTEILEYFPLIARPGRIMQSEYVKTLQEDERNDLRILAIGYYAKLKYKSTTWITIDSFKNRKRIVAPPPNTNMTSTTTTTTTGTPLQSNMSSTSTASHMTKTGQGSRSSHLVDKYEKRSDTSNRESGETVSKSIELSTSTVTPSIVSTRSHKDGMATTTTTTTAMTATRSGTIEGGRSTTRSLHERTIDHRRDDTQGSSSSSSSAAISNSMMNTTSSLTTTTSNINESKSRKDTSIYEERRYRSDTDRDRRSTRESRHTTDSSHTMTTSTSATTAAATTATSDERRSQHSQNSHSHVEEHTMNDRSKQRETRSSRRHQQYSTTSTTDHRNSEGQSLATTNTATTTATTPTPTSSQSRSRSDRRRDNTVITNSGNINTNDNEAGYHSGGSSHRHHRSNEGIPSSSSLDQTRRSNTAVTSIMATTSANTSPSTMPLSSTATTATTTTGMGRDRERSAGSGGSSGGGAVRDREYRGRRNDYERDTRRGDKKDHRTSDTNESDRVKRSRTHNTSTTNTGHTADHYNESNKDWRTSKKRPADQELSGPHSKSSGGGGGGGPDMNASKAPRRMNEKQTNIATSSNATPIATSNTSNESTRHRPGRSNTTTDVVTTTTTSSTHHNTRQVGTSSGSDQNVRDRRARRFGLDSSNASGQGQDGSNTPNNDNAPHSRNPPHHRHHYASNNRNNNNNNSGGGYYGRNNGTQMTRSNNNNTNMPPNSGGKRRVGGRR